MSTGALAILAVAVIVIGVLIFLWLGERDRAVKLEAELEDERARRDAAQPIAGLPPLKTVLRAASKVRSEGITEALLSSFDDLTAWAENADPGLRDLAAIDGTLTIFFSDIEGSTSLNQELGDRRWLKTLGAHDQIVRRCAGAFGGHVVKSQGDGFMIAFAGAEDAIRSAIGIQRKLDSGPRRLRGAPIRVRIGIHTGPALEKSGDLFGRSVALAARVTDQAEGGEILVTAEAANAAEDTDLVFAESREVELKGFTGFHELSKVVWKTTPGGDPGQLM